MTASVLVSQLRGFSPPHALVRTQGPLLFTIVSRRERQSEAGNVGSDLEGIESVTDETIEEGFDASRSDDVMTLDRFDLE